MATIDLCGRQVEVDTDNHLVNQADWNEELAGELGEQAA
jgi:sulfur relay (sulfurtransferase) DsrC/TusE family protein